MTCKHRWHFAGFYETFEKIPGKTDDDMNNCIHRQYAKFVCDKCPEIKNTTIKECIAWTTENGMGKEGKIEELWRV